MAEPGPFAKRILVAGVGNIFEGDDGFGVEVIKLLLQETVPPEAHVEDFGIRGYDLAFALAAGYELVILVDATRRGHLPGTVYLLELDLEELKRLDTGQADPHQLNPLLAMQMAQTLGGVTGKIFLVGCEPAVLANDDGEIGLSEAVREAVPQALTMIQALLCDALGVEVKKHAGLVPS